MKNHIHFTRKRLLDIAGVLDRVGPSGSDRYEILGWLWTMPTMDDMTSAETDSVIDYVEDLWDESKGAYDNIDAFMMDLIEDNGLEKLADLLRKLRTKPKLIRPTAIDIKEVRPDIGKLELKKPSRKKPIIKPSPVGRDLNLEEEIRRKRKEAMKIAEEFKIKIPVEPEEDVVLFPVNTSTLLTESPVFFRNKIIQATNGKTWMDDRAPESIFDPTNPAFQQRKGYSFVLGNPSQTVGQGVFFQRSEEYILTVEDMINEFPASEDIDYISWTQNGEEFYPPAVIRLRINSEIDERLWDAIIDLYEIGG